MQLWRIFTGLAICSSVVLALERREQREFDYFLFVRCAYDALLLTDKPIVARAVYFSGPAVYITSPATARKPQQWAPSYCDFHSCSSGHEPTITDFSIHGLWPDYDDGSYPSFCSSTKFSPSKVSDLLQDLKAEWPTYAARGGDSFWKHEYEKHGTCATATFPDEHDYFAGVLALNQQYNLLAAFEAHGISPSISETYPATDMEAAIEAVTGVRGSSIVNCKDGEVDEVDICMDKQNPPQPIACPNKRENRCGNLVLKPLGSSTRHSMAA